MLNKAYMEVTREVKTQEKGKVLVVTPYLRIAQENSCHLPK